jgi:hypothetical protein
MKYIIGVLVVLAAIFMVGGLGAISDGIKDFRTDLMTDSFVLSTNTTTSNGTVQLNNSLWENQISDTVLVSNISGDTPALLSYTPGNKNLLFNGLATNTTRLITVQYRTAGLAGYPGVETGIKVVPSAIILSIIVLPLLAVVMILLGR